MDVILAIDLGKYNSVFCRFDVSSRQAQFGSVVTTPDALRREVTRSPVQTVVFEACSQAGWLHDLCAEVGVSCLVANTNGEAWAWRNVIRKTDRDDALKLARLTAAGELQGVAIPDRATRQWKSLIGLRKRLVGERIRGQNRIRGLLVGQGLPAPIGAKAWTALGLAGIAAHAKPLAECGADDLWRGELATSLERFAFLVEQIAAVEAKLDERVAESAAAQLLLTIPGVGPRTAEVVATHLTEAKRFRSAGEVSAYAGLVPRQYQSGQTDRRGGITRRGPRLLRSALVECAWCSLRYNAWARGVWLRLQGNGVSKKKAIVALARKLLVRCWAVLKHGEPWREPEQKLEPAVA